MLEDLLGNNKAVDEVFGVMVGHALKLLLEQLHLFLMLKMMVHLVAPPLRRIAPLSVGHFDGRSARSRRMNLRCFCSKLLTLKIIAVEGCDFG